jgi:hypothetical protein
MGLLEIVDVVLPFNMGWHQMPCYGRFFSRLIRQGVNVAFVCPLCPVDVHLE